MEIAAALYYFRCKYANRLSVFKRAFYYFKRDFIVLIAELRHYNGGVAYIKIYV